jgi:ectoine hydroxylase-related dioxygenase (phytanoyl-CoA dioxygenase family)
MTEAEKRQLDEQGYVALVGFIDAEWLRELRARLEEVFEAEDQNSGCEFRGEPFSRHADNLVDKGEVFERMVCDPRLLVYVSHVLSDSFKLSSLTARSTNPHAYTAQPLHCDTDRLPDDNGPAIFNSVWLLDDFTCENGATRVVPGSHLWGRLPRSAVRDPKAPYPGEVIITAPAGSVIVYNAHIWHGGTANHTTRHRRALHASFTRRDLPQQQWQRMLLRPETQARIDGMLRYLLALDDAYNDILCAAAAERASHA